MSPFESAPLIYDELAPWWPLLSAPEDTTYQVEYALLVREPGGEVRVRHARHLEGLFATDVWVTALRRSGFTPHVLHHHHVGETHESVVFVGTKEG